MTQYKLIKTPEQFIIVSNENIEKEDIYYNTRLQNIYEAIANSGYNTVDKEFKVIAQQNQIDFNGFEDIVGYVDVEKLAKEANGYLPYARDTKGLAFNEGYIEGFNKANELSSNKQFSLEDIRNAVDLGLSISTMNNEPLTTEKNKSLKNISIDSFIQSLQQPKEWMIEIAMEKSFTGIVSGGLKPVGEIGSKGLFHHTQLNPKLINGKIQIAKIL